MPTMSTKANTPKGSPRSGLNYMQMIVFTMNEAQKDLPPRKGISLRSLKSKIFEKYGTTETILNRNLHRALDEKVLMSTKGQGLSGSVRFHNDFANRLKKLDDASNQKSISETLTKYLNTSLVQSDDSDDERVSEATKKPRQKKTESAKRAPKKRDESAKSNPKAKKAAGEPTMVTGKASKKRAAEKSSEEPKVKKSK
ncbi:histone H1, gonadal [Aedes aegypti]|uniref:Uncharacterized protein n=1 Tax=Aedes aegypti TaxID=7159 RepID=A0A1S4F0P4_AEDAE|nr:histone H1, gonadal [Aedes aegypti]